MDYAYYPDHRDPMQFSVADYINNQWRGVITLTKEGKWVSENGKTFNTRIGAANDNAPGSPPLRPI